MPTYQYTCTDCGTPLEAVQSFSDAALTECPTCGGRLRKVFSAVGVVFKGSGFYKTDSRGSGSAKDAPAKGESSGGGDSKPEPKKADAKPATTSGSTPAATSTS